MTEEEYVHVPSLLEKHPEEGLKRGRKLLDLDVRLVILLEWLRRGETYKELVFSYNITNSQVQNSITSLWNSLSQALFEDIIPTPPWVRVKENFRQLLRSNRGIGCQLDSNS